MQVFGSIKNVTVLSLMIATVICLLSGCSNAQEISANSKPLPSERKILIVYLSRTNNTKAIAEFIHQKVGGTLVALELETPYPADYNATVQQIARENETGYLPPLKTKIERIEQYDIVFLGFPTWGMQLPPPVKSFLRQYSLNGKRLSHSTRMRDMAKEVVFRLLRNSLRRVLFWKASSSGAGWKEMDNIW
jgi:flavodoxin